MELYVEKECPFCGETQRVEFRNVEDFELHTKEGFTRFSYMTASQRETLISGICDNCWENMMPDETD